MIPENQLARGIQHKIIQGPVAEPPAISMWGKPIKKMRNVRGRSPPTIHFFLNFSTKSTISQKLKIAKKWKLILHKFQNIVHLLRQSKNGHFLSLLLSSISSTKSSISHQLKISKIGKLFFHRFQNVVQLFGTKTKYQIRPRLKGGVCMHVVNWDRA